MSSKQNSVAGCQNVKKSAFWHASKYISEPFHLLKVQKVQEEASNHKGKEPEQYKVINSFIELLTRTIRK
jgi:hypothetical protein